MVIIIYYEYHYVHIAKTYCVFFAADVTQDYAELQFCLIITKSLDVSSKK